VCCSVENQKSVDLRKWPWRRAVQPGVEKAPGRPYCALPVSEGACRKAGEGLLIVAWSDRTRGDGFKLKERGDLDWI